MGSGATGVCGDVHRSEDRHRTDSVERALLEARALIESSVSLHRSRPGRTSLLVRADDGSVVDAVKRLMGEARYSAHLAVTSNRKHSAVVCSAVADSLAEAPRTAREGRGRLAVRLLASGGALELTADCRRSFAETYLDVRMTKGELREALIVDGRTALVQSGNGSAGRHAAIITDPAAVGALDLLFAGAWAAPGPSPTNCGWTAVCGARRRGGSWSSSARGAPTTWPRGRSTSRCAPTGVTSPTSCASSERTPGSRPGRAPSSWVCWSGAEPPPRAAAPTGEYRGTG